MVFGDIFLHLSSNQVYFSGTSMVKINYLANHWF